MSSFLNIADLPLAPSLGNQRATPSHPARPRAVGALPFSLPEIGVPINQRPPAYADVTNPGDSQPQRQQFAPATIDQTRSVVMLATGIPMTSDGQIQRRDYSPGQQGITVTTGNGLPTESNGQFQRRDMRPVDKAIVGPGLPMEAKPDSQNPSRVIRQFAKPMPVAVDVDGGHIKPGGLPRPVIIK